MLGKSTHLQVIPQQSTQMQQTYILVQTDSPTVYHATPTLAD